MCHETVRPKPDRRYCTALYAGKLAKSLASRIIKSAERAESVELSAGQSRFNSGKGRHLSLRLSVQNASSVPPTPLFNYYSTLTENEY
jgi:hypothetical protein